MLTGRLRITAVVLAAAFLAVMLLLYPQSCIQSALDGMDLWLRAVFPSLFPFMVVSFLLIETGIVRLLAHIFSPITRFLFGAPGESAYVFFAAALSGYPVGARLTGELYAKGMISETEAQRMVRFTSVSGPVFLTGAVSTGLLAAPQAGFCLAASHYLGALLVGVLFGLFSVGHKWPVQSNRRICDAVNLFWRDAAACPSVSSMLCISIEKTLLTMLKIGGFIILFSVVIEILIVTGIMGAASFIYRPLAAAAGVDTAAAGALLSGSLEMAVGCAKAASLDAALGAKLILVSGIVGFGGLCVHMQTSAVLAGCGLKPKRFVLAKGLQGLISSTLTFLFISSFPLSQEVISYNGEIKTAAYSGAFFAGAVLLLVLLVKLIVKRSKRSFFPFTR